MELGSDLQGTTELGASAPELRAGGIALLLTEGLTDEELAVVLENATEIDARP